MCFCLWEGDSASRGGAEHMSEPWSSAALSSDPDGGSCCVCPAGPPVSAPSLSRAESLGSWAIGRRGTEKEEQPGES